MKHYLDGEMVDEADIEAALSKVPHEELVTVALDLLYAVSMQLQSVAAFNAGERDRTLGQEADAATNQAIALVRTYL